MGIITLVLHKCYKKVVAIIVIPDVSRVVSFLADVTRLTSGNGDNCKKETTVNTTPDFNITKNAADRIAYLLAQEEDKSANLRIAVLSGGCSGFQYNYDFDTKKNPDDLFFEKDGVTITIDQTSLEFIKGSTLDYVESMSAAAFEIKNPNSTANCGCGNSFSV
jgi:iron-sulfur cluster insertion protein